MQFTLLDRSRIEAAWPAIAEILAPAIQPDPTQTIEGLHKRLAEGADWLFHISGPGHALIVFERPVSLSCWVKYLAGHIEGGPKARVAVIRQAMAHIENMARDAGCTEVCLCGRDWSAILPDYEPLDGHRNGLRKEL